MSRLPSNDYLLEYSAALPWSQIEQQKRKFNHALRDLAAQPGGGDHLPLERLSEAMGAPVTALFPPDDTYGANILLGELNGRQHVLASAVSGRYRGKKTLLQSLVPYNFNPSVNHSNIHETDDPVTRMRSLGAEIELGLVCRDGTSPSEADILGYISTYKANALRLGITPQVDREAGKDQIEAHIAPVVGYQKTRAALHGIFTALALCSDQTGLLTTVLPAYPVKTDFQLTQDPKVQTAVDLMLEVNGFFPEYAHRLEAAHSRYHVPAGLCNYVQMFRIQGCHIHLDLAGRSEALGLLTFYTMLRSASAIANAAVLKGAPFVNGTCDPELLCTREYLRGVTATGRYLELPTSPHLTEDGLNRYAGLLRDERVNAPGRAMLYDDGMGRAISVMHNPIGRVRPDLTSSKRICTLESTGMPASISASRLAAVLTDFEYSHVVIEDYFRKHGCDLGPMFDDKKMWAILGPLQTDEFQRLHDASDRECTDIVLTTAAGTRMTLAQFYDMKRTFMHRALLEVDSVDVTPRDIDEVYVSLTRMLEPPSGHSAQTIHQFVADPKLKSTGNWGRILRDRFIEMGGTPGEHNPELVMKVVQEIHDALRARYLQQ